MLQDVFIGKINKYALFYFMYMTKKALLYIKKEVVASFFRLVSKNEKNQKHRKHNVCGAFSVFQKIYRQSEPSRFCATRL